MMIEVAIAIIFNESGEVLINRRKGGEMIGSGLWEFPGGKVEESETVKDALVREVNEEFGIKILPLNLLKSAQYTYGMQNFSLNFWRCKLIEGSVYAREGHEWIWSPRAELFKYKFLPANKDVIGLLVD